MSCFHAGAIWQSNMAEKDDTMLNLNPQTSHLDRLFLFWHAYDKEAADLLQAWHLDAARARARGSSGNVLYDSFLDTWGNGEFENNLPLEEKSYFSALGVVSKGLRDQCTEVLDQILERQAGGERTPGGRYKVPLQLLVDRPDADSKAEVAINDILRPFDIEHTSLKDKIDPFVADEVEASNHDPYLEALQRMMNIETKCFSTQKQFLETGNVPN
jgi:hypothetical protein